MRWRSSRKPRESLPERASWEMSSDVAAHPPRRRLASTFQALRHRNYRLYWFGQLVSLMGTNMQTIGQAWLVLQLTNSAWQLGIVGAVQFLPVLLFSMFGGVFADRWPKRRVLLITQTAAMAQALLMFALVATGAIQLWHIYVLALLLGLTISLDQPTRSAFVVELAGSRGSPQRDCAELLADESGARRGARPRRRAHRRHWRHGALPAQCAQLPCDAPGPGAHPSR